MLSKRRNIVGFERFVLLIRLNGRNSNLGHQLPGLWDEESVKNNYERN